MELDSSIMDKSSMMIMKKKKLLNFKNTLKLINLNLIGNFGIIKGS